MSTAVKPKTTQRKRVAIAKKPTPIVKKRVKRKVVDASALIAQRNDLPRMMGSAEVCDVLGIRVQNLQFVRGLPEPVQRIRATRLWLADEVLEFAQQRRSRAA